MVIGPVTIETLGVLLGCWQALWLRRPAKRMLLSEVEVSLWSNVPRCRFWASVVPSFIGSLASADM
jgi:hypothetical protein